MSEPLFPCVPPGVFALPAARFPALCEALANAGIDHARLQPEAAAGASAWLRQAGRQLGFADDFGANFDALYDSLCDRDLLPQTRLVLLVGHCEALRGQSGILLEVLQAVSEAWQAQGRQFWGVVDLPQGTAIDLPGFPWPSA